MKATCVNNFAQPGLELNKEYEVEKLEGELLTLKDLPFQRPVELFKIEGSLFEYGFCIKDTKIKNKRQCMRDLVYPELGQHVFKSAYTDYGVQPLF